MTVEVHFDAANNVATCGGEALVFHCHFYNCALHEAIENGMGERAAALLERAAARTLERQLRALDADAAVAEQLFRSFGFGVLDLSATRADGGEASVHASHYAMGWSAVHGEREKPVCLFPAGFIRGAVSVIHGVPLEALKVTEIACFVAGAERCRFEIARTPETRS